MTHHPDRLGTVTIGQDGHATLRFVRQLRYAPERVWTALTDAEKLSAWFMPATLEPRLGGRLHLLSGEDGGTVGEILRWEPPAALAYSWARGGGNGPTSVVLWRLTPDEGGTRLVLEHSGLDPASAHDYGTGWHDLLAGWHDLLDQLPRQLAGQDPADRASSYQEFLAHYRAATPALAADTGRTD